MKVTQEKVTVTKVKSAQVESITTNLTEFNLAEAVFLHKGRPSREKASSLDRGRSILQESRALSQSGKQRQTK